QGPLSDQGRETVRAKRTCSARSPIAGLCQQEKSLRILLRYARVPQGGSYSVLKLSQADRNAACLVRLLPARVTRYIGRQRPLVAPENLAGAVSRVAVRKVKRDRNWQTLPVS